MALGLVLAGAGSAPVVAWLAERGGWQLAGARGSLWTGLHVDQLRHTSADLQVEGSALTLAPLRWRDGAWRTGFSADRLRVQSAPSTRPPPSEAQLLRALDAPLPVALDRLHVRELVLQGIALHELDASLQAGGESLLALQLRRLGWVAGGVQASGDLRVARDGTLALRLGLQGPQAHLQADGRGPLARWPLRVALTAPDGARAELDATLQPLAPQPLRAMQARFEQLDLQALHPQAPRTRWQGGATLAPQPDGALALSLQARNALALRLDEGGWPLRALTLQAQVQPQQWQQLRIDALQVDLGTDRRPAGAVRLAQPTAWPSAGGAWALPVQLQGLQLAGLDGSWPALQVDGRVLAVQEPASRAAAPLALRADLRANALNAGAQAQAWRFTAQALLQGQQLTLDQAELAQQSGPGRVQLSGRWTGQDLGWSAQGRARVAQWPLRAGPLNARVNAQAEAQLRWQGRAWHGQARLNVDEGARLAELPLQGQADWTADDQGQRWRAALQLGHDDGPTELEASGALPQPLRDPAALGEGRQWQPQQLRWRAPALERLRALWQPWWTALAGRTEGQATLDADGRPTAVQASVQQLRWQAKATEAPVQLNEGRVRWVDDEAQWQLQGLVAHGWQVPQANGRGGRQSPWQWQVEGQAPGTLDGEPLPAWRWEGSSGAPVQEGDSWTWPALRQTVGALRGASWLQWEGAQARWAQKARQLRLDGGRLALRGEAMHQQALGLRWHDGQPELELQLEGRLQPAPWLAALQPDAGWQGDLRTDLHLALQGQALDLRLTRHAGDLRLDGQPLGLEAFELALTRAQQGALGALLQLQSPVLGQLQAEARVSAASGPLSGQLRARLPNLHLLQAWLPAGLQLRGQAEVDATLAGTLAQPRFQGQGELRIERLQHAASGLGGRNGVARWRFDDSRLALQQLDLQGLGEGDTGGWLRGQGEWAWGGSAGGARLAVQAEGFRLLNRFDRQLSTSGQLAMQIDGRRLQLRGRVQADQGVFDISQGDAPSLDDDVRVSRPSTEPATPPAASRWQRDVQVQLDLGQRLRVQGRGLATRLTGQLQLLEQGGQPARWTGVVEMGGGRYKAYGQTLDIESGELRFTGALDNPRLDILALRPDLEVRVGVRATGSAQTPRIRLYSEPDMADNDKLAWLLLGRAPDELGRNDTALLQRAALALLSGEGDNPATQLMDKLGLTEFSVSNSEDAGATLRLGAQLSKRWSVGYERSLNAATGSWQLVYRLGQRFRLRAQSGTDSALDALWLWRFD